MVAGGAANSTPWAEMITVPNLSGVKSGSVLAAGMDFMPWAGVLPGPPVGSLWAKSDSKVF